VLLKGYDGQIWKGCVTFHINLVIGVKKPLPHLGGLFVCIFFMCMTLLVLVVLSVDLVAHDKA